MTVSADPDPTMDAIAHAVTTGRAGDATAAREHAPNLPDGPYGDTIRAAIDEVADAIDRKDRTRRVSAPGATG